MIYSLGFRLLCNTHCDELLFRMKSNSSSSDNNDDKSFSSNADDYMEYPVKSDINS